jgi:8-oxo-dGTP pyrophosphatase MutT (NUDIX family)
LPAADIILFMSDELNPWKTNGTMVVYSNPWIEVSQHDVIQPDGTPGIYGVVHFKNRAIGVLPIDDEGFVYLVGQWRYPLRLYSWEIPEGGCPEDEEPFEAAVRELAEETGLTAKHWEVICQSHLSNSVSDESAIIYLATGLTPGVATPDATEDLAHRRVHFSEAVKMVQRGEITDSMSVMAIMQHAYSLLMQADRERAIAPH